MSVMVTTYLDGDGRPALSPLPEARALCDGCGTKGPAVECRPPERLRENDSAALSLAVAVASFVKVKAFQPMAGASKTEHRCAACMRARAS